VLALDPRLEIFQQMRRLLRAFSGRLHHDWLMGDLLAIVGIAAFVVSMLGLVWALDRV
jgi:glutathione S-transferase